MVRQGDLMVGPGWHRRHVAGAEREPGEARLHSTLPVAGALSWRRSPWLLVVALAIPLIVWVTLNLWLSDVRLAVMMPGVQAGVDAASALARFFGALALVLIPADRVAGRRFRWVAAGFVILGLGALVFGVVRPLLGTTPDVNTRMYASLMVRTIAGALFVVALVPAVPPRFSPRWVIGATVAACAALGFVAGAGTTWLPALVHGDTLEASARSGDAVLPGLTGWHWAFGAIPLLLAAITTVATARRASRDGLGGWLVVAMVLLTGSLLHDLFWPSAYAPVLTSSTVLRLAFAATIVVGGILELRRIAAEHAALLAAEQEYSHRLADLADRKADFTAIVAHELGSPIAAIRGYAEMLATGELDPDLQRQVLGAIQTETDMLNALVADVRTIATVERDDFAVYPCPVQLALLLADAAAFAKTLPGDHPVAIPASTELRVRADPERIGQVLRNLLSNAAKYSPAGTPIELRIVPAGMRVRVEVADCGFGIPAEDLARIFEKFERGRHERGRKIPGHGLGLYLSRRIVQAHGSDLTARSTPGEGSVFGFELEGVA
ncbi:MAG: HAMP domain-containing histidine kinase [Chloroflexota bacterium]|nr:HAMP domain-containing histidine kinase [Chloroflexota bacterium]